MEAGDDLLERFKRQAFGDGMVPFRGAVASLETRFPRLFAKQEGRQRWVVCGKYLLGVLADLDKDMRYCDE